MTPRTRAWPRVAAALSLATALAAAGAPAPPGQEAPRQDEERPLDARTYAQGIEAVRQGKRDEAFRALRKVFQDFPDSAYAPQAALKVAELIYPVASWDQVGSSASAAIKEAGDLLAMLAQKYRSSREAPRALVKLGFLLLEPGNPKADLDAACERFATASRVYPDSDAADDAYFGSGMCEALRARPAHAADFFSRLLDESPASPLAAEALYRFGMALSHLGDTAEAMLALQEVRSRFPDSRYAARALDRISLMHRLRLASRQAPGAGPGRPAPPSAVRIAAPTSGPAPAPTSGIVVPAYRVDESYGPSAGARPASTRPGEATGFHGASDIDIDAQGLAVLASPKSPGVFRLDARGRVQERIAHPGPEYVTAGEGLAVYISGRGQIAVNTKNWSGPDLKGADGRPPRGFGPLVVDPAGRVHLLDGRGGGLLIYDRARKLLRALRPEATEGRFIDLARSEDGAVYVLEERTKVALELHQGKETRKVNLSALGVTEPVSLAADGLGDLFVLDGKTGWVYVADPDGRRLAVIKPPKEILSRLGDPTAVAVDAIGRVYLCGRKGSQVVRFR